ncbi:MAG TPA: TonB-dependent receptor [Opitutaceae bacterium]|nr:TonB-dependent receptor [Opitutaceae bacterium]
MKSQPNLFRLLARPGVFLAGFVLLTASAFAQAAGTGTVTGTVLDVVTGKYLEGAEVVVNGTNRVSTAREGAFELRNVPAGAQTLVVSYPGMESKSVSATVTAGQVTNVAVHLGGEVVTLGQFTVAGTKEGMAQAVALQKISVNTKVVAAGDQYGDIAEGNAAEYLRFLPGVGIDYNANDARAATLRGMSTTFTSVTLNGNPIASATSGALNRRFEFEQVSINNVETVEVLKTLNPETPATSTGGQINLVTKSALDREGNLLTYRAYLQGTDTALTLQKTEGWGQEKTRKILPGLDLNYAVHLRPNLGLNVSYKNSQLYNDYPRSSYTWEYNPANGGLPTNPALTSWNLQNEQKDTRRQSLSGQVDWKIDENTKLSATGMWTYYDLLFTDRVITVNTGNLAALSTTSVPTYGNGVVQGRAGAGSVVLGTINRWKSGVTWIGDLALSHDFSDSAHLDAGTYWSQSYSKYRDSTGGWYSDANLTRSNLTVNFANVGKIAPSYTVFDSTGAPVDLRDLSQFSISTIRSRPQTAVDTRYGVSLDFKNRFDTAFPIELKVGGRVDLNTRNIDNRVFNRTGTSVATGFGNPVTGSQLVGMTDTGFSNHPIGYGLPAYNFVSLYSAYTQLGGMAYLPYTPSSDTIARFVDTTSAPYARLDVTPVTGLLVSGGVRYEKRNTDAENRLSTLPSIVKSNFSDKSWFPSLNLKYTPNNNLVFRLGLGKTIGLPDYSDLLPGAATITAPDNSAGTRGKVSIYNPNLKAYDVKSYDASVEYYFSHSSVVSLTAFRKDFTNFIITATQALDNGSAALLGINPANLVGTVDQYDVTYKFNVPEKGHYNGLEFGYAQNFTFLPKPFNTLGLQVNGTILSIDPINSHAVFSSTDAKLSAAIREQINKTMEFAAVKEALNVTLNYSIGKFALTATSSYTGHVLKAFSQKTVKYSDVATNSYYNEYQYQAPRELIDARIDYKWSNRVTPYFQARNILGRPIIMSTPTEPFNHAEYGDPIFEVGVRGVW